MSEQVHGRLATCSYKAFRPEMGHAVRITRGAPRYKLGYELAGSVMQLAPSWPEWQLAKAGDSHAFVAAYQARLTQLGVANLSQLLQAGFPTGRLILLCFESLDGLREPERILFCHRRAFAEFWQRATGDELPELSDQPRAWKP